MANIVGLGQTQDDPAGARRRLDPAVPLQDGARMRLPDLKPTASPVDIYYRPAQAPINNDLHSLAEGLSALNPALTRFMAQNQKVDKEIDKDAYAAKYQPMTKEQLQDAFKKDPELQNTYAKQFVGNIYAEKAGLDLRSELVQAYNDPEQFDKSNGDFLKFSRDFVAKRGQELFANDKAGAAKFYEGSASVVHSLHQDFLKEKLESNDIQRQQLTQTGYTNILRDAVNTDMPPEKIVAQSAEFMRTNKLVMNQLPKKQMEIQLTALDAVLNDMDKYPEKRDRYYAAANAILTGTRVDEHGVEHRLIDTPGGLGDMAKGKLAEFAKKRNQLNDQFLAKEGADWETAIKETPHLVDDAKLDQFHKASPGLWSEERYRGLLVEKQQNLAKQAEKQAVNDAERAASQAKIDVDQSNVKTILDGDVLLPRSRDVPTKDAFLKRDPTATSKYGAEEQEQRAIELVQKTIEAQKTKKINAKQLTEEEADQWARVTEIETFRMAGIVPKAWKDEIKAGARQLTVDAAMASKEMPQGGLQAFRRFKTLTDKAPNLVSEVADGATRDLFETAMVADGNETEQLRGAILYRMNKDEKREAVALKQVDEAMKNQSFGEWLSSFYNGSVENYGAITAKAQKRASFLVQAHHMNPEDAVKRAVESLKSHFTTINGVAIDTSDKRLPPNVKEVTEGFLKKSVETVGKEAWGVDDASDLVLTPINGGNFLVTNKRNPIPATAPVLMDIPDGRGGTFQHDMRVLTPEVLQALAMEHRRGEERASMERAEKFRGVMREDLARTKEQQEQWDQFKKNNPFPKVGIINKNSKR